jgi:ribosomal protein S27AE
VTADQQHAFPVDAPQRTVCGLAAVNVRQTAFIPADQQDGIVPRNLCGRCAEAMAAGGLEPARSPEAEGVCPQCGGDVLLDADGRISGHNAWIVQRGVLVVSDRLCEGAGEWPEATG